MNTYINKLKREQGLSVENYFLKRILVIAVMIITALSSPALGQTTHNKRARKSGNKTDGGSRKIAAQPSSSAARQPVVPLADHHTHIWSLDASKLATGPLLPVIELPEALARLLRERDEAAKQKDPAIMAKLYTEDALFLNPLDPKWLRGEPAIAFIAKNTDGNFRAVPVAYATGDAVGYIAGYWTSGEGTAIHYDSNFLLSLRKGSDGQWRIAAETITASGPPVAKAVTAEQLIAEMDAAGVRRAAVLSVAYWYGKPSRKVEDEYAKVRAENDWVAAQVARYPDRLVGFCSFSPLKDYAIEELNRCAKNPNFKGLKFHFGNSGVDVLNPQHVEKVRAVFRAANEKRLSIVVHLWTSGKYGREHAEAFLNQILPAAPDIPIQIAHMAASGPNYHSDDAFEVYANAAAHGDPRMRNVYTDVASMVTRNTKPETLELVAKRLRQFGLQRTLFGSDRSPGFGNDSPKDAWEAFRRLPLTEKEFRTVAGNVAPYMR
jgi:predicted TIM-barrel fold metal-dependent hydrolase